ncbi:unnamed protein product [Pelagomonas calceolata]|uniref:Uncharacterized protein n=1 Tax=Pelagomonas calceolata TaxID=35677 RepID=A0A8J2WTM6_9STRA|nr:unnamed protein product [Pelagomonas calceolata]
MTNAVIKAFVDLDSLRSCANDPGMVDDGLMRAGSELEAYCETLAATARVETNRVLGVPRPVANCLHAAREALAAESFGDAADARLLQFEADALLGCLNRGLLQYDEFGPGDTMLILPRGGHAVLTGRPHKVVLAGEWHLTPDGVRAAAVPASLTSPRPFAEEEAAPMPPAANKKRPESSASPISAPPATTELKASTTRARAATTPFHLPIGGPTTPAAPAAGRRRRTRPVPGSLPPTTPLPPARPRPTTAAEDGDEPPRQKKPCFGPSETLEAVESRFLSATLPQ